jgi:hypothetical protein
LGKCSSSFFHERWVVLRCILVSEPQTTLHPRTFALELLLAGVPLERVSILLGHSSIKVTEKHYSPWIRERQEQAEADVKRTWAQDPLALLESKGTLQVHGKGEAVN